ncbi:hypothetical protein [Sulfurimonas sp. CS5]|jgi:hypothetical protein|uniref:hypothetical protein n=1 Tax=Sulfurimonas sp. CS5 TaxID=3391145 RepID=UPI0039ED11F4
MDKKLLGSLLFSLLLLFTGCSTTYYEAKPKDTYTPTKINVTEKYSKNDVALIKVADGISIWEVDGERKVNAFKMILGLSGLDSILIPEGDHRFACRKKYRSGYNIRINNTFFKGGHEYLVDYLQVDDKKIYYWVEDLTDGKIVYGKKVTAESLSKEVDI